MPLYDYKCRCGEEFDAYRSVSDRLSATCPKCHAPAMQAVQRPSVKRVSGVTGWYEHIARDPIYIKNRKHLREECARHDCYAVVLD